MNKNNIIDVFVENLKNENIGVYHSSRVFNIVKNIEQYYYNKNKKLNFNNCCMEIICFLSFDNIQKLLNEKDKNVENIISIINGDCIDKNKNEEKYIYYYNLIFNIFYQIYIEYK